MARRWERLGKVRLAGRGRCTSHACAVQRRGTEPLHRSQRSMCMTSPSSPHRLSLRVGMGFLILLTGAVVHAADTKRGDRFTGPWDLNALRQAPKVTTIKQEGA